MNDDPPNTYAIDKDAASRFVPGQDVDDLDRRGNPIRGCVVAVKEGQRIALVIVEPRDDGTGAG